MGGHFYVFSEHSEHIYFCFLFLVEKLKYFHEFGFAENSTKIINLIFKPFPYQPRNCQMKDVKNFVGHSVGPYHCFLVLTRPTSIGISSTYLVLSDFEIISVSNTPFLDNNKNPHTKIIQFQVTDTNLYQVPREMNN